MWIVILRVVWWIEDAAMRHVRLETESVGGDVVWLHSQVK